MLKNPSFSGYSHNASKPPNLIYSVQNHLQNSQEPLNVPVQPAALVNPASGNSNGPPSVMSQHKPANSSTFLALANQAQSNTR